MITGELKRERNRRRRRSAWAAAWGFAPAVALAQSPPEQPGAPPPPPFQTPDRPARHAVDSPLAIVEAMYAFSAGPRKDYSGRSAFYVEAIRARYFMRTLRDDLAKVEKDNVGVFDFDPVTNSSDPAIARISLAAAEASEQRAVIVASIEYRGIAKPSTVRYIFVRDGGAWKIDDMEGGRGPNGDEDRWSLRARVKERL